jgi:hypothetical protein
LFVIALLFALSIAGCGGKEEAPPTFQELRTMAVAFLKQMNKASNDLQDAYKAAGINEKLGSGDFMQQNAALTALAQLLDGYLKQVNSVVPPSEVPEAPPLKIAVVKSKSELQSAVQDVRSAIQEGSKSKVQAAFMKLGAVGSGPGTENPHDLEQAMLTKYNIPDNEVNYRRPQ